LPDPVDAYLLKYKPTKLILKNYDYSLDNNNLIGIAKEPSEFPITVLNPNLNSEGLYSIKPSFNVDIGYDFSDYDELKKRAKKFKDMCIKYDPFKCVEKNKDNVFTKGNFELIKCGTPHNDFEFLDFFPEEEPGPTYRSKIFRFCVSRTVDKFYTYDQVDDQIIPRNIVYKFALKFEDIACYEDRNPDCISHHTFLLGPGK